MFSNVISCIGYHGISRVCTLIVRETFAVSRLEAQIELSSGKTSNDFNTYLDHLGVKHPRHLPLEITLQVRHFYGRLHEKLYRSTCEINLGRARSQGLPRPDLTTWERPCPSLALKWEATTSPKRYCNYPEAGEWVLVQLFADEQRFVDRVPVSPSRPEKEVYDPLLVRIFRGDFTLL